MLPRRDLSARGARVSRLVDVCVCVRWSLLYFLVLNLKHICDYMHVCDLASFPFLFNLNFTQICDDMPPCCHL